MGSVADLMQTFLDSRLFCAATFFQIECFERAQTFEMTREMAILKADFLEGLHCPA